MPRKGTEQKMTNIQPDSEAKSSSSVVKEHRKASRLHSRVATVKKPISGSELICRGR